MTENWGSLAEIAETARELIDVLLRVDPATVGLGDETLEIDAIVELLQAGVVQDTEPEAIDPVSGAINPIALPLKMDRTGGGVRAEVTFPYRFQGPLGLLHGGLSAATLERALTSAASAVRPDRGRPASREVTVRYHRPVPLLTKTVLFASAVPSGDAVRAEGTISVDGAVCISAEVISRFV